MRKILYTVFFILMCLLPQAAMAEADTIQCSESNRNVICRVTIPEFVAKVRQMLTNGWENTIQIQISLMDSASEKVISKSRLEATQRCYLDPFESPCLLLWRGASKWQRYRDENAFLHAFSHFNIQALTLGELPADNYVIRLTMVVVPSAQKRMNSILNWGKTGDGDSGASLWNTNSLIGSVVRSRAEGIENQAFVTTLETTQFYIDVSFDSERTSAEESKAPESGATETKPETEQATEQK